MSRETVRYALCANVFPGYRTSIALYLKDRSFPFPDGKITGRISSTLHFPFSLLSSWNCTIVENIHICICNKNMIKMRDNEKRIE